MFLDRDLDRGSFDTIPIPADMPKVAGGFCSPVQPSADHVDRLLGWQGRGLSECLLGLLAVDRPRTGDRAKGARGLPEGGVPLALRSRRNLGNLGFQRDRPILRDRRAIDLPIPTRGLGLLRGPHLLGRALHEIRDQPVGRRTQGIIREHVLSIGAVRVRAEDAGVAVAVEDLDTEGLTEGGLADPGERVVGADLELEDQLALGLSGSYRLGGVAPMIGHHAIIQVPRIPERSLDPLAELVRQVDVEHQNGDLGPGVSAEGGIPAPIPEVRWVVLPGTLGRVLARPMRTRGEAAGVKVRGDSRQPLGVEVQEAVAHREDPLACFADVPVVIDVAEHDSRLGQVHQELDTGRPRGRGLVLLAVGVGPAVLDPERAIPGLVPAGQAGQRDFNPGGLVD